MFLFIKEHGSASESISVFHCMYSIMLESYCEPSLTCMSRFAIIYPRNPIYPPSRNGATCPLSWQLVGHPEMMATVLLCQVSHIPLSLLSQRLVGCPGTVPPCLNPTCPLCQGLVGHPGMVSLLSLVQGGTSWDGDYCPTLPSTSKSHCPSCPLSRGLVGHPGMVATVRHPQIPLSFLSLVPGTGGTSWNGVPPVPCPR